MYTTITPKEKNDIINYAFNKQASDTTKNTLIGALAGALGGSGVGYLSYLLTPKDKDENKSRKFWSHLLSGAAFGTMAGAGLGYYTGIKSDKNQANQANNQNNGKGDVETATDSTVRYMNKTPAIRVLANTAIGSGVGAGVGWGAKRIVNSDFLSAANRYGAGSITRLDGTEVNPISKVEGRVAFKNLYDTDPTVGEKVFGSNNPAAVDLANGKKIQPLSSEIPSIMYRFNSNPFPTTYKAFKKLNPASKQQYIQALINDGILPLKPSADYLTDDEALKKVYKTFTTIRQAQNRFNPFSKRNIVLRNINSKTLGATGALIGLLTGVFGGPSTGAAD